MKIRNLRSIIIISAYVLLNAGILVASYQQSSEDNQVLRKKGVLAPEYTQIEDLDYFHLKQGVPQMSLSALKMQSQGEEIAEFVQPKGIYNYQKKQKVIRYQADEGKYQKARELVLLSGNARVLSDEAEYLAARIKYYFVKDLVYGFGGVTFNGEDPKSKDELQIKSETMRANPSNQISRFKGNVHGYMQRKKKYEGKSTFSSQQLQLDGIKSLAVLTGDVKLTRQNYLITAGKGDIYLENYNKSLKYFVFNDDVKVTEKLQTPEGTTYRKAFSERLEGFGKEQKMVLSGAPRVEHGKDVVKGYRITLRENMELLEVDDAMSDMQMKKKEEKKN